MENNHALVKLGLGKHNPMISEEVLRKALTEAGDQLPVRLNFDGDAIGKVVHFSVEGGVDMVTVEINPEHVERLDAMFKGFPSWASSGIQIDAEDLLGDGKLRLKGAVLASFPPILPLREFNSERPWQTHARIIDSPYVLAEIIHGATRVLGRPNLDPIPEWKMLPHESRNLAAQAVAKLLSEPPHTPEELHEIWAEPLRVAGWVYGHQWCGDKKHHPCLVPYESLPESERLKDAIWAGLIEAFRAEAQR